MQHDLARFDRRYFEDPDYPAGLKGGDEVQGYGYYPEYFPIVQAQLSSLVELLESGRLLDAGCGKGALAAYARRDLHTPTVGLDGSAHALGFARRHFGGADSVLGDISRLPFPSDLFDLCWSNGVLQYLSADQAGAALRELARVTRRAAFISNIAAAHRYGEWGQHDHLTRLYLRPAQWEGFARAQGLDAVALPFEGESAILILKDAPRSLPLRFVELSLERMKRLGALQRTPPPLDGFYRKMQRR